MLFLISFIFSLFLYFTKGIAASHQHENSAANLDQPFRKLSMTEAVAEHTGISLSPFFETNDLPACLSFVKERGFDLNEAQLKTVGDVLLHLFEEEVEEKLVEPTIVFDYPLACSPLARENPNLPGFAERFEVFCQGMEIANAYSELNDPMEQLERFRDVEDRDEEFLQALMHGMPPTAGLGIGIDRLVMLLTNASSIKEVLAFRINKPQTPASEDGEEKA